MAPGERLRREPADRDLPWLLTGDLPPHLLFDAGLAALHRFLPRNEDPPSTVAYGYGGDEFRMYEFKVRRCHIGRSHDWTECPYAHPGEKARRRDPRRFHYSGTPCLDFRRSGGCSRGNACEFAHGVFETWLHPARYRTQPCKDGPACPRRVCFFAHSPEQLRIVLPTSPKDGGVASSSPTSTLALAPLSPPSSGSSPPLSPVAVDEVAAAMRALQLNEVRSILPFGRDPLAQGTREAAERWLVGVRAGMFDCWKREEQEQEQSPDLGWISELVKD